jgi:hypothetical protein
MPLGKMEKELRLYKDVDVLRQDTQPDSVYYVLNTSKQEVTEVWITSSKNEPKPVYIGDGGGGVNSVTGTGVIGTAQNPIVNISTFLSSEIGNRIKLSTANGKLVVKPITSLSNTITVVDDNIEVAQTILDNIAVLQAEMLTVNNSLFVFKVAAEPIPSHTPIAVYNNLAYKLDSSNMAHQFAFVGFSTNGVSAGQICNIQQIGEVELANWGLTPNEQYLAGVSGGIVLANNSNTNFTKVVGFATTENTIQIIKDYTTINK